MSIASCMVTNKEKCARGSIPVEDSDVEDSDMLNISSFTNSRLLGPFLATAQLVVHYIRNASLMMALYLALYETIPPGSIETLPFSEITSWMVALLTLRKNVSGSHMSFLESAGNVIV